MMRRLGALAAAAVIAACGSSTSPSPSPSPSTSPSPPTTAAVVEPDGGIEGEGACADEGWGGWDGEGFGGEEACAEAASRTINGADKMCASDADCVVVGTNCDAHGIAAAYADEYRSWPSPCTHPAAGECMGPCGARCVEGCCQAVDVCNG